MAERPYELITSGAIEQGRRTYMQDGALKLEREEDGFTLKRVYSSDGVTFSKEEYLYRPGDPLCEKSLEWLNRLGILSIRFVVDGVTRSGLVENAGGLATFEALEGFAHLFLEGGLNYPKYYSQRKPFYPLEKLITNEFWPKLNRRIRERAAGGQAVAALLIETPFGFWGSWVGDPVIEIMSKKGSYKMINTPDTYLWRQILKGKYDRDHPMFGKRPLTDLDRWDIFLRNRGPLNTLDQALGQAKPLSLENHVIYIDRQKSKDLVVGVGTDGIGHPRKRVNLLQKAKSPEDFVKLLQKEVAHRRQMLTDNLAYRVVLVK